MKSFVILFLLLNFSTLKAQDYYKSCEEAKAHAIHDAQTGILKARNHGLRDVPEDWDPEFENYFETYIYSKYGIEITEEGCMVTDEMLCYSYCICDI